jgi:hypothetical protein
MVEFVFGVECSEQRRVVMQLSAMNLTEIVAKAKDCEIPMGLIDIALDDREPRKRVIALVEAKFVKDPGSVSVATGRASDDETSNPTFEAEGEEAAKGKTDDM